MSPMRPVRARPSAASNAPGPPRASPPSTSPSSVAARTSLVGQIEFTVGVGEVLIFHARDFVGANGDVTTTRETQRLDTRRAIERFGDRCAPVDDEGVERFVGDRESAHVIRVAATVAIRLVVDATKEEGLIADGELIEPVKGGSHHHVALHEVARAAHVRYRGAIAQ